MKRLYVILAAFILVLACAGCTGAVTSTSNPISTQAPGDHIITTVSEAVAQQTALDCLENSATFKFDGIPGSIRFIRAEPSPISSFRSTILIFEYRTAHPGHGDRSGQMLAQVITDHSVNILVNDETGNVASAVCDRTWDMVYNKVLPVYVSGFVVSGGDTTPSNGPLDTPHRFIYKIGRSDGTFINVGYTGYPPSPVGEAQRGKIRLDFYAGSIKIGDRLEACGTLDEATNTVTVANQGDYIRTSVPKVEVTGKVVSLGDAADPDGPQDAPRKLVCRLQKDDGTVITISFTAYPPSPAGDAAREKITLSLWSDSIQIGDYMKACGTLDVESGTISLAEQGDFLKTYPEKP
jgi:hypothetical protein